MNFINAYRNTDGSVTVHHVDMTKAAYQHLYDSVMSEYDFTEFIDMTMEEKDPEQREKLYRKLILETYLEEVIPLSRWCYRGSEKEANNCICIEDCTISKETFENMEDFVTSYADDSVLYDESEDEKARESSYITNIVEDYVREQAMSADLASIRGDDDLFETVFERYFY